MCVQRWNEQDWGFIVLIASKNFAVQKPKRTKLTTKETQESSLFSNLKLLVLHNIILDITLNIAIIKKFVISSNIPFRLF